MTMNGPTAIVWVHGWENPKVQHGVGRAFMEMDGTWDPDSDESRDRLLGLVRDEGFPQAALTYDPVAGALPRVFIWPEGRTSLEGG
jgi:hypothetical protein